MPRPTNSNYYCHVCRLHYEDYLDVSCVWLSTLIHKNTYCWCRRHLVKPTSNNSPNYILKNEFIRRGKNNNLSNSGSKLDEVWGLEKRRKNTKSSLWVKPRPWRAREHRDTIRGLCIARERPRNIFKNNDFEFSEWFFQSFIRWMMMTGEPSLSRL